MLNHLTTDKSYEGLNTALRLLTTENNLAGQQQAFLLSCKVDGLSPATISYYNYQIGRCVSFFYTLNCTDAQYITAQHIRLFLLKLQETNCPNSVHDYYRAIKRFFNWLIQEGLLDKSPMVNIKPPRVPMKLIKPFSHKDIENLLLLCNGNRFLDSRNKALILLFLDTGVRNNEMANIQLANLNFDSETINIMGKGAKERVVRMGKTAQKALLSYLLKRNDGYPCLWVTEERRPMTAAGIQTTIKVLCRRADIKGVKRGPHTFRHTAAIHYLRNGGDDFTLQLLLGHSTLEMTRRYVSTLGAEDMLTAHRKYSPVDNLGIK